MEMVILTRHTCVAVVVAMAGFSVVNAEAPPHLFWADEAAPLDLGKDPVVVRSRAVVVNVGPLSNLRPGDRLVLNLFDDVSFIGVVDRADGQTWSGALEQEPAGTFALAIHQGRLAAIVRIPPSHTYRVRSLPNGQHVVQQLDESRFAPCGDAPVGPVHAGGGFAENAGGDDGSVIDVLVVYTPVARMDAGGGAAIEAEIALAIAQTNTAYMNSLIGTQLNLVHTAEIPYDEVGSYSDHLNRLTNLTDGYMDSVHPLRNQVGADLVALLVADSEFCGIAWLMNINSPAFEFHGFSVTTWFCAVGNLTFAHELGHNQGCCHAVGDGGGCNNGGLFPHSVGWRFFGDSGTQWRTVMAYAPGSRITQFSNPDIVHDGQSTGVPIGQPDEADNAASINQTSLAVANFRSSIELTPIVYVDDDAPAGGIGSGWDDAFDSLGTALGLVAQSEGIVQEVWVAAGTYTPVSSTFQLVDGVGLYGGFAGGETSLDQRDWVANETILSGDVNGDDGPDFENYEDNRTSVVTGDGTAVLDGFIIEAGNAVGTCGGGMRNDGSSPTVINCIFRANLGTAMCNDGGSPTVINCLFRDNVGGFGGAMSNEQSDVTVINCTFFDNVGNATGGGINNVGGAATIINCTITGNTAGFNGGAMFNLSSTTTVTNTIVWANGPNDIFDASEPPTTVSYSDVQGGFAGIGNIDADPMFVDPAMGDYRLLPGSPGIDAANNIAVPAGITTDLDGNPRFVDDPNTPDCPQAPGTCGDPPVVDMGAYESQSCTGDLDGDGIVGIVDFLALLGAWGSCDDGGGCLGDLDGDGEVGIIDFLALLAAWGACP